MDCNNCSDSAGCEIKRLCPRADTVSYSCDGDDDRRPCDGSYSYTKPADKPPTSVAMVVAHVELSAQSFTCLTFATVAEAERFLTIRFGCGDGNGRWYPASDGDMKDQAEDFFLEYWDECGGIASFTINAAQHGKPFTVF